MVVEVIDYGIYKFFWCYNFEFYDWFKDYWIGFRCCFVEVFFCIKFESDWFRVYCVYRIIVNMDFYVVDVVVG